MFVLDGATSLWLTAALVCAIVALQRD